MSRLIPTLGFALAILAITPTLAACAPRDEVIWSDKDDAVMNAAEAEARASLPYFWAKVDSKDPSRSNFMIKVGLPTDHGGVEHIWTALLSHEGDVIMGRLDQVPEDVAAMKAGAEFRVNPAQISDWMYMKSGKLYGSYTTRAMMDRVSPENRKATLKVLAPTPLEPAVH